VTGIGPVKLTVVIAEDDFLVSKEVVRAAEGAGFEVAGVARDGEEAVALVARVRPAAAILDIEMPKLSGLDAARRIRDTSPVPVVILTAYGTGDFLRQAGEAGVGAYLTKPPTPGALARAVEIAVARHADLTELRRVNEDLRNALADIRTLQGLLSVCSGCRKIRDDAGAWMPLEKYVTEHTNARVTHGLCPDCLRVYYPDVAEEVIRSTEDPAT